MRAALLLAVVAVSVASSYSESMIPPCMQSKHSGKGCASKRFYFNAKTRKCEKFYYKGTEGNSNNFETPVACQLACGDGRGDMCRLPKDSGETCPTQVRYYFNASKKKCIVG